MLLTKLGNAVDVRQEKLASLEAKSKQAAEQSMGWNAISSAVNSVFTQPPPRPVAVEPAVYVRELKAIRDMMTLVGEVFDLYPSVVSSFEKQHQSPQEGGSTLTADELEALIPPLEEADSPGLLGPGKQRRYVPRGLVQRSIDDIKGSGPRAEYLVLTYESEMLVKFTLEAEDYLTIKVRVLSLTCNNGLGWDFLRSKVRAEKTNI